MKFEFADVTIETSPEKLPKGFMFNTLYNFGVSNEVRLDVTAAVLAVAPSSKMPNITNNTKRVLADINEQYHDFPSCTIAKSKTNVYLVNIAAYEQWKSEQEALDDNDD